MSRKLLIIVLGCTLLVPAAASAWFAECTPGFWKNHEEVWCGVDLPRCSVERPDCCAANIDCDALLQALNTGGACPDTNGDGLPDCPRHEAARFLNSCYNIDVFNPCPDE